MLGRSFLSIFFFLVVFFFFSLDANHWKKFVLNLLQYCFCFLDFPHLGMEPSFLCVTSFGRRVLYHQRPLGSPR